MLSPVRNGSQESPICHNYSQSGPRVTQWLSPRRNWDSPSPPLAHASVSPPGPKGGQTRLRVWVWRPHFRRLKKKLLFNMSRFFLAVPVLVSLTAQNTYTGRELY